MTQTQRNRALKTLDGAYKHLSRTREIGTCERAITVIAQASSVVRNGFKTPITYEFFGFDTPLWDGSGKPLYSVDSIEAHNDTL